MQINEEKQNLGQKLNIQQEQISNKNYFPSEDIVFMNQHQHTTQIHWWYQQQTKLINDPIVRFHNEIIDYYLFSQPEKSSYEQHLHLFHVFKNRWLQYYPIQNQSYPIIAPFLINKIYLKSKPIQIFIMNQKPLQLYQYVEQCLEKMGVRSLKTDQSQQRKYNILRIQGTINNTNIIVFVVNFGWYSFLNSITNSIENIAEFKYIYYVLCEIINTRQFLRNKIHSYLLYGIISAYFYYQHNRLRIRTLTNTIIKILEYYGMGPLNQNKIIYHGNNKFNFQFWISAEVQISCNEVKQMFALFKNRYRLISNYNFLNNQSILGWLINPKIACQLISY